MSYRDRRLRRAERLRDWADRRTHKAAAAFRTANQIAHGIPMGQPILVGHHSERRHRRDIDRMHRGMTAGLEHEQKAEDMTRRAAEIERQADRSIYSDDADAIDRLKARIAELEAQRDRIKAINKAIRQCGPFVLADVEHRWEDGRLVLDPPMTEAERRDLLTTDRIQPYHDVTHKGYPPYVLQNLNGKLTRQKKRLAQLAGAP